VPKPASTAKRALQRVGTRLSQIARLTSNGIPRRTSRPHERAAADAARSDAARPPQWRHGAAVCVRPTLPQWRRAVRPWIPHSSAPIGSSRQISSHGSSCSQAHRSMPTSRRLPPVRRRTSTAARERSRSPSCSDSVSLVRSPARQSNTIKARSRWPWARSPICAHHRDDLLDRRLRRPPARIPLNPPSVGVDDVLLSERSGPAAMERQPAIQCELLKSAHFMGSSRHARDARATSRTPIE
jgi:hypothetical protein